MAMSPGEPVKVKKEKKKKHKKREREPSDGSEKVRPHHLCQSHFLSPYIPLTTFPLSVCLLYPSLSLSQEVTSDVEIKKKKKKKHKKEIEEECTVVA